MRKLIYSLALTITIINSNAQTRKILLEEFSGAKCGSCPVGNYLLDSMLTKFSPNIIGVALHTYKPGDAMFFAQIDTIGTAYASGAPLGAINRFYNPSIGFVAIYHNAWNNAIQTELAKTTSLTVSLNSSWNPGNRNINTVITSSILTNISPGDYRFNLYVVEDSVIGIGNGYDQANFYHATPGSPFFGMGNPIIGYVHKHTVRAILPQSWGIAGIVSNTPMAGQIFTYSINYTLPVTVNENKVHLVAFVSRYTLNHQGDYILNAEEIKLPVGLTGLKNTNESITEVAVYPNPTHNLLRFEASGVRILSCKIWNTLGELIAEQSISNAQYEIDVSKLSPNIYYLHLKTEDGRVIIRKVIIEAE